MRDLSQIDVEFSVFGIAFSVLILLCVLSASSRIFATVKLRFANLRLARDRARLREARARDLARRDQLTGLLNRRGFSENTELMLAQAEKNELPAALLLLEIDRLKTLRDVFGDQACDAALCRISERLARWEGSIFAVARLGKEQFGLLTIGMEGAALARFAERIQRELNACDHSGSLGDHLVSVLVGVARADSVDGFETLYGKAFDALRQVSPGIE